jgi:TM2 domain-containing membrane protein YozV
MKAKHAIILIVIGYCLNFVGGLLKILHTQEADAILVTAAILTVFGVLLFLVKVIKYPKFREFLNS